MTQPQRIETYWRFCWDFGGRWWKGNIFIEILFWYIVKNCRFSLLKKDQIAGGQSQRKKLRCLCYLSGSLKPNGFCSSLLWLWSAGWPSFSVNSSVLQEKKMHVDLNRGARKVDKSVKIIIFKPNPLLCKHHFCYMGQHLASSYAFGAKREAGVATFVFLVWRQVMEHLPRAWFGHHHPYNRAEPSWQTVSE